MLHDDHILNLAKLMDVSLLRARIHAANLANQNTPGYRARRVAFEEAFRKALVTRGAADARAVEARVVEAAGLPERKDGNNVSTDAEVTAAAENMMLYNAYSTILRGKYRILDTALTRSP